MRTTFFVLVLALAASANAASFSKRAISSAVQTCVKDLTAAQAQIEAVTTAVNGFTAASGYAGALGVHNKEQALEALVKTAKSDCCAVTTVVSTEEANAVIDVVKTLVPDIESALGAIVSKKDAFNAVVLAANIVKSDIKNLQTQVTALDNCIVAVTPSDFATVANEYVSKVDAAFANAKAAYNI
ncbi:hypothetical protein G6F62_002017 [Rhizopus arrhizus]|nr:hypothetical protein G6F62_002017 [Rhizopus arrhizus]